MGLDGLWDSLWMLDLDWLGSYEVFGLVFGWFLRMLLWYWLKKLSMILIEPNWKKGVGKGIELLEQ